MIGLESCFGAVNKVLCVDNNIKIEQSNRFFNGKTKKDNGF